jgi:hypothetical protein
VRAALTRWSAVPAIAVGAVALRLITGVGFVNYDTLYALAWGGQLSRGVAPAYDIPIAPTPHPLLELLGLVLVPLGPHTAEVLTVALAFLALSGCGWVLYALGREWFGRAAGALAALLFLTRAEVLSYGVRSYVDLPYLLLALSALLVESRHRRAQQDGAGGTRTGAGAPVLVLLAFAGLLRPEAWVFSGLYWLYLVGLVPSRAELTAGGIRKLSAVWAGARANFGRGLQRREIVRLSAIAACAPVVWILSDLLITGNPLWSLTHTQQTAETLHRVTGIANVPEYIPRRIGQILRPPVLVGAALGGVLSLLYLRRRALLGAIVGVIAVLVFAFFASLGLTINTRYAFLTSAILCIFCGAGVFGWTHLPPGDPRRRWWLGAGAIVLVALVVSGRSQYNAAHRQLRTLAHQHSIERGLLALVSSGAINLRCGPVGVPNHAPVPLLALYLKTSPRNIVSLQSGHIHYGVYVDPADKQVEEDYVLDSHDPVEPVSVPPGFTASATNRSWLVFQRCL